MIITNECVQKSVRVAFHIGRGGRFFNPGFKSFVPNRDRLQKFFDPNGFVTDSDAEGNPLPDEEWKLLDSAGNVVLESRDAIESDTGVLDWDGDYNTDIVKEIEDCTEDELQLLYDAYLKDLPLDDDAIDYILAVRGMKRISSVQFCRTSAVIFFSDHTSIDFNYDCDESLLEDDIKLWLSDHDIDERSIDEYLEDFLFHFERD